MKAATLFILAAWSCGKVLLIWNGEGEKWAVENSKVYLKIVGKMCLCFLEKLDILKSVDEHPHKQVKLHKNTS